MVLVSFMVLVLVLVDGLLVDRGKLAMVEGKLRRKVERYGWFEVGWMRGRLAAGPGCWIWSADLQSAPAAFGAAAFGAAADASPLLCRCSGADCKSALPFLRRPIARVGRCR